MKKITIDTNILPADDIVKKCKESGYEYAIVSVTNREVSGSDFEKDLNNIHRILETAVWDESLWNDCVWGDEDNDLEEILNIISNGSFPKNRSALTNAQKRMLRDTIILEAHIREKRDVFVTDDKRAFINHGRKKKIEDKFNTRILTKEEFLK